MISEMIKVTKDFETQSTCDLRKAGAYKYSLDPSTRPTALAFRVQGEPETPLLRFRTINRHWKDLPAWVREKWQSLVDGPYLFSAHNSFFERCIYDNILVTRYGWPAIDPRRRRCTAAKAAACALPRNLEGAGAALNLKVQKDKRGYVAMMRTCRPTKEWNAWRKAREMARTTTRALSPKTLKIIQGPEPQCLITPDTHPEVFEELYRYCKIDVLAEELLDATLPDLSLEEQEIWFLNQELNWRGLRVDLPTVNKVVDIMAVESKKKLKELDRLTMGLVTKPGARQSILDFLALDGVELPNLQAKTVDRTLQGFGLSDDMRRLLEIRKALSLSSTKKYHGMQARAGEDGRIRDILMYHGASTGRDTGTGLMPHNFPRGVIPVDKARPYAAVENVASLDHEMLQVLYGDSLPLVFSSILRNMIIPSDGFELFVADFSKIEVAVLWWLAGNEPGLKVLRAGLDPYKYQAAANIGGRYEDITDESNDRNLGKAQILGCGFGLGAPRFRTMAALPPYNLDLTEDQALTAVQNYRRANAAVPALWKEYENAAVAAVETGRPVSTGWCRFFTRDHFLWIELPSERRLAYRDPQISWRESEYGPRKTLEFWGVNPKTRKWALERTWGGKITENIVQGTARDLMMPALVRLEKARYRALLAVHDEAICERKIGRGNLAEFVRIFCEKPTWAPGLPLEAKGWKGPRYRK